MKKGTKNLIIGVLIGLTLIPLSLFGGVLLKMAKKDTPTCDEHVWGKGKIVKEATCAEEGEMLFECKECGRIKTEPIATTEHHFEDVSALAPTCTEAGHTEYAICIDCGAYKNDVAPLTLPKRGHYYLDDVCIRCGAEVPSYAITYKAVIDEKVCDVPDVLYRKNGEYPTIYYINRETEVSTLWGVMEPVCWEGFEGVYAGAPFYVNGGDGYMFYGWFLDEECTEAFTGITETQRGDLTLYARIELDLASDWTSNY